MIAKMAPGTWGYFYVKKTPKPHRIRRIE